VVLGHKGELLRGVVPPVEAARSSSSVRPRRWPGQLLLGPGCATPPAVRPSSSAVGVAARSSCSAGREEGSSAVARDPTLGKEGPADGEGRAARGDGREDDESLTWEGKGQYMCVVGGGKRMVSGPCLSVIGWWDLEY
jgi:hypothetical protein